MAISGDGEVIGSVSGGCVDGAVVTEARQILDGAGPRMVRFGYSDEDAFSVGLTCGGVVHLYLERYEDEGSEGGIGGLWAAVGAQRNAVLVTVVAGSGIGDKLLLVDGSELIGRLADPDLHRVVEREAEGVLASGVTSLRHLGAHGETDRDEVSVFLEAYAPPPRLLILGAADFTAALVRVAKVLGYHVTVCDAREVFATQARFPQADEVVVDWPHRHLAEVGASLGPRDAVCVLTHDAKFDVPAIVAALETDVGYLGAMGSRRTTDQRLERLRAEGVSEERLQRLLAPIGLDLGARTPEETAVAICAEIITHRTGRSAPHLRDATGPIHEDRRR